MRKLSAWMLLFALSLSAQSLRWKPNTESDLAGYNLYIYGPTNFTAVVSTTKTNFSVRPLPDGPYQALLTAFNTAGLESNPAGPVTWTNSPGTTNIVIYFQRAPALGQWTTFFSVTNTVPRTNAQEFYRLEIRKP